MSGKKEKKKKRNRVYFFGNVALRNSLNYYLSKLKL